MTQTSSVTARIKPMGFDETEGIKMLLYGQSGSGKTTLWSTFPGPILAIICSGGMRPGELRSINTPEMRKKVSTVTLKNSDELLELVQSPEIREFRTVVLDHASGYADLALKDIQGLDDIPVAKYRIAGKGESWSTVSQQQYGSLAIVCKTAFRGLLNLHGNVVIVAQERVFNTKEDGVQSDIIKPSIGAALTPSLTGWLNPACDYVIQMFKRGKIERGVTTVGEKGKPGYKEIPTEERGKGVDYCARTEPHDVFMTKFRMPLGRALPECVVNPTYEKLMALIRGESK